MPIPDSALISRLAPNEDARKHTSDEISVEIAEQLKDNATQLWFVAQPVV
jgi:hypothetical protein